MPKIRSYRLTKRLEMPEGVNHAQCRIAGTNQQRHAWSSGRTHQMERVGGENPGKMIENDVEVSLPSADPVGRPAIVVRSGLDTRLATRPMSRISLLRDRRMHETSNCMTCFFGCEWFSIEKMAFRFRPFPSWRNWYLQPGRGCRAREGCGGRHSATSEVSALTCHEDLLGGYGPRGETGTRERRPAATPPI